MASVDARSGDDVTIYNRSGGGRPRPRVVARNDVKSMEPSKDGLHAVKLLSGVTVLVNEEDAQLLLQKRGGGGLAG